MKNKTLISLRLFFTFCSTFCLSMLFMNSCKKADIVVPETTNGIIVETPQNFFNLPANASPVLKRVAKELERQNKSKEFIEAFIAKEGFPVWGKSRIERQRKNGHIADFDSDGLEDTTVYIPLVVSANNYVTGFLKATVDDSVDIKIYRQNDYVNFPLHMPVSPTNATTAENFALRMMTMDRDVFGTTTFKVKDKRMFNFSTDYSDTAHLQRYITLTDSTSGGNDDAFANGSTINNYQYEVCWSIEIVWWICPGFTGSGGNIVPGCYLSSGSMSYCTTYEIGGGTGGGSGPGGGNPTGGGGTWPFPPSGPGGGGAPCSEEFGASITNSFIPIECNPSGGNPWPPISPVIQSLRTILGISSVQMDWFTTHLNKADKILTYLQVNNGSINIANAHIIKMMQDLDYLTFDNNHGQTGNNSKMWWEDEAWLESIDYVMNENIFNFYMDATKVKNLRPIESANICSGIPSMIGASAADKKERMGYITLDGQFIQSPRVGTSGDMQVGIRIRNGQAYYNYKMNLGAPSRSYFGQLEVQGEYWIPVRTNVHIHVPDFGNNGAAITTTNPSKSDDDATVALLIQKNLQNFNLYVAEVKDNGKYLVASYSINSPDYTIEGNDLLLANVCNLIN